MHINRLKKEVNMCAKNAKFGALHFIRRVRFFGSYTRVTTNNTLPLHFIS